MRVACLAFYTALAAAPAFAEPAMRVAVHVDDFDIQKINMALNNVENIQKHYAENGQEVQVEIVAYGPGLHMMRADTSPVAQRIETMALSYDNLTFSACLNTVEAMTQKEQKDVPLLDEVTTTPSGAVRLIELQQQGWTYLKP